MWTADLGEKTVVYPYIQWVVVYDYTQCIYVSVNAWCQWGKEGALLASVQVCVCVCVCVWLLVEWNAVCLFYVRDMTLCIGFERKCSVMYCINPTVQLITYALNELVRMYVFKGVCCSFIHMA